MTEVNPFAPPVHDDEPVPARALAVPTGERFFIVSKTKLAVMSFATFGLYELYWFYRNWRYTKARTGSGIWPVARSIFALFFTHALLRDISVAAVEVEVQPRFSVQGAAWGFIILTLTNRLPEPFWMVSLFAVVPLLSVQDTINEINRTTAPTADPNSRFSAANWLGIALGLLFWGLIGIALFLPEEALSP